MDTVVRGILRAHQARFAHAEHVEHLSAPEAREFFTFGCGQRLRRADELAHRAGCEIDAFGFREIGEVKREAAHADQYRRAQRLDELELRGRRIGIAGADPDHADAEHLRTSRPNLTRRVDAERKRDVAKIAAADADTWERAPPRQFPVPQIVSGAWIKHRLAGRAARAPIFRDLIARDGAERFEQLGVREFPQRVLVEDRNLSPLGGIVERVGIDAAELVAIPRHGFGQRERLLFSLALNLSDVSPRVGQWKRKAHCSRLPGSVARAVLR